MQRIEKNKKIRSPFVILLGVFAFFILLGSLLLLLPISLKGGQSLSFIDALFLSTSAVCVTGLVSTSVTIGELLSPFGVIVLWLLIEIGGLGFITFVTFIFSFSKKKIGISTNVLLKEAMNQNSYQELIPLAKKIIITSFIIQFVGFIFNTIGFMLSDFSFKQAIWYSFFHTAAAFCNAGFDLLGNTSLVLYRQNFLLMATTSLLVILGGIGFVVMFEVIKKKKFKRFNLHTKIVIKTTLLILIFGTLLTKMTSWNSISWSDAFLQVVFARSAGFFSVNLISLRYSTLLIIMIIMFIGGSPASVAGGIKTTTFYTIFRSIFCFGKKKDHIIAYNREINKESILKSYVLVTVAFVLNVFMAILLILFEELFNPNLVNETSFFAKAFFEVISAFSTCGTSLGITSLLSIPSKLIIILLMYFGRLGPITFISLLNRGNHDDESVKYVEEDIIIG